MDFSDRLNISEALVASLIENPDQLGIDKVDLADKTPDQQRAFMTGEFLAELAKQAGLKAVEALRVSDHTRPDWFDHRFHLLVPEEEFLDFWTASADNVIRVLPLGGKLLDLCAGDGFYDYWFFRRRASEIVCVDKNEAAHRQAIRLHGAPIIKHCLADVLTWEVPQTPFDVVVCRGAIEHFSKENQLRIFQKAYSALRPGGWFCGDTPALLAGAGVKLLEAHEHEWLDEEQMRTELAEVFPTVLTSTLVSRTRSYWPDRVTLLWQAQRP